MTVRSFICVALLFISSVPALAQNAPASNAPLAGSDAFAAFESGVEASGKFAMSIGAVNAEGAGAVASEVTISATDSTGPSLAIAELRLYGEGAAPARIDARGVSLTGLEAALQKQMDATYAIMDVAAQAEHTTDPHSENDGSNELPTSAMFETTVRKASFEIERIVLDGFVRHKDDTPEPVVDNPLSEFLSATAGPVRSFSAERAQLVGLSGLMEYEQAGVDSRIAYNMSSFVANGLRRGDMEMSEMRGIEMTISADGVSDTVGTAPTPIAIDLSYGYERITSQGVRLARLYEYAARGELPPAKETNILSLGRTTIEGERQMFGDQALTTVKHGVLDLTNFHWLVPTRITWSTDDAVYNFGGLMRWVQNMSPNTTPEEQASLEMMQSALDGLESAGADRFNMDNCFTWVWDPNTGFGETETRTDIDKAFGVMQRARLNIGDIKVLTNAAFSKPRPDGTHPAVEKLMEKLSLSNAEAAIEDRGGIETTIAAIGVLAAMSPEIEAGAALFTTGSPAEVRKTLAMTLRAVGPGLAASFPPGLGYVEPVASFIDSGGTLRVGVAPKKPLGFANLAVEGEAPDELIKRIGASVTRNDVPATREGAAASCAAQ